MTHQLWISCDLHTTASITKQYNLLLANRCWHVQQGS